MIGADSTVGSEIGCDFTGLLPNSLRETVNGWLQEDTPSMDIGGFVVGPQQQTAHVSIRVYTISTLLLCVGHGTDIF